MTTHYAVVEADPRAVEGDLTRIWRDNLPIPVDPGARFAWTRRAPLPAAGVFMLTAEDNGAARVVGSAGVSERRFDVFGKPVQAAQLVDLAVDRPHRVVGPALSLVRETRRAVMTGHTLAYGLPNASARALFRRVGYRELGAPVRWVAVLRYAPYLQRHVGRPLGALGGALLDAAAGVLRRSVARGALRWVEQADARFDALWDATRHDYDVIGCRDADFLRWRFFDNPACRVRAATLCGPGGELRSYAIVERRGTAAHILDLFGKHEALGELLEELLPALRADGASSASFAFLGPAAVRELLAAHGFSPRQPGPALFFDANPDALARTMTDKERWYVTDADDDA